VYYRIFIFHFSIIAAPIFGLFRKGVKFEWTVDCQVAMDSLKTVITMAPVFITLDLTPAGLVIYLNIDASMKIGWGAVMSQLQTDGSIQPAIFEGGIWSDVEKRYDALNLECWALLIG